MKTILTVILVAFSVFATAQSNVKNEPVVFSKAPYQFEYPKHWMVDTSKSMGADVFIFSPIEDSTDQFRENVNVMIQNLSGQGIDLEKYKQLSEQQVEQIITDGKILESTISKSNGVDRYVLQCEMTQGKFRLRISSVCYIADEKAYLMTFTSELSKHEVYKPVQDRFLKTFKVGK